MEQESIAKASNTASLETPLQKSTEDCPDDDMRRKSKRSARVCQYPIQDDTVADYGELRQKSDSMGGLGRRIISKSQMRGKNKPLFLGISLIWQRFFR